ncbi:MAG TPA: TadE/TadG family type IV pilus assembly protein [Pyrinomonadaceae bacterium]|nr:TadE/TadG family type IV pilus assembly protein [Pyrinomonadaceae bacterium]
MRAKEGKPERKGERGSVLVLSTIGMLAFLLIAGLAIDVSHFYTAKAELQNAADASALAGASQLNSSAGGIKQAVSEATKVLNKYDFKQNVSIPSSAVSFSSNLNGTYVDQASAEANPTTIRFVKVTIPPKPVNVFFAAFVIGGSKNIGATATAGMSVGLTMNKFNAALAFIEADAAPLQKNQTYTLSAKSWNSNAPNSYRVLEGGSGDLLLTGNIHVYDYPVASYRAQQLADTDACRLTRIGFNARFGDYSPHPGGNTTNAPPDTITRENITYSQYRDLQGSGAIDRADGMDNRRIIFLPVAKSSAYNTSTRNMTSNKLGAFFIKKKVSSPACTIEVEYIGERLAVPVGEYRPGQVQASELAIPVLYK